MADEAEVKPFEPGPPAETKEVPQVSSPDSPFTLPGFSSIAPQQAEEQRLLREKRGQVELGINDTLAQRTAATTAELQRRQGAQAEIDPFYDSAKASLSQPVPAPPAETQYPQAPDMPVVDPEQFKNFFGPMMLFSLVLGRIAKADMVDGLNMLSSSITGYVTGAKEKAQHDAEVFKQKMDAAIHSERAKIARYQQVLESQRYNIQQKMDLLKIEAMREDDKRMNFALEQGNYDAVLKAYDSQLKLLDKQENSFIGFEKNLSNTLLAGQMRQELQDSKVTTANESLALRREIFEAANQNNINKAVSAYQKSFDTIAKYFANGVRAVITKAGMTSEIAKQQVEMLAYEAASMMKELRVSTQDLRFTKDGKPWVINVTNASGGDAQKLENPDYWKRAAQGFEKLSSFVPQVGEPSTHEVLIPKQPGVERVAPPAGYEEQ